MSISDIRKHDPMGYFSGRRRLPDNMKIVPSRYRKTLPPNIEDLVDKAALDWQVKWLGCRCKSESSWKQLVAWFFLNRWIAKRPKRSIYG